MMLGILADPRATAEALASVDVARRTGELRVQAQALRGLGRVLDWQGEEDSALAVFRDAEHLFRQGRDRSWLAVTFMNQANTLRRRGDLGEAIATLHLALTEGELSHNLWAVASAHTGLGAVAMSLNDLPAAAEHLKQAVTMFESQGDQSSAMNARKFLPLIALADGDFGAARPQAEGALAFYRGTGETPDEFAVLRTLITIAMRERDWATVERRLADQRALLPKLEGTQWGVSLTLDQGRLARARDSLARAEQLFRRLLGMLDSTQHVSRYDARLRLAEIYSRRRDLHAAEREATLAWDELERYRATLTDRELRLLAFQVVGSEYQVSPASVSEQRANVARVLATLAAGGRMTRAFELAERRRARDLMDRMVLAQALRTHVSDASSRQPVAGSAAPLSAWDLAALIPDSSTAVLEYVTGGLGAPTTLFVISRAAPGSTAVRARTLAPADSLAGQLSRFLAVLQRGEEAGQLAAAFARALLAPALEELGPGFNRLILVPDGPLHRVPWDMLRLADGRYLVERYAVSVAPSAAILAELWRHPRTDTATPAPLLAFGDPSFPGEPRLEGSGREARLVADYSPDAVVRLRENASAGYLRHASLEPFRVIHFATHADVDDRSAARMTLKLAPDSSDTGLIGPGDLAALRLDADLVVLSGCRTAGGVLVEGEGIQGLTAPLIQAGARSVVASQWRIGDRSTIAFVRAFYAALAKGLTVGDALRAAKLDALRRGASPKEWAAFTIVGDPLARVALRSPRPDPWRSAVLVATLALGVAGGIVYSRRRQRTPAPPVASAVPAS